MLGRGNTPPVSRLFTARAVENHVLEARSDEKRPSSCMTSDRLYRSYARGAAVVFLLVALYTLLAKVPSGQFARDWMHTALHVGTGSLAVYAGWIADRVTPAIAFTAGLALAYGTLGLFGWFRDGLLMDSALRIPLGAADNIFHLALALAAALTVAIATSSRELR